jgi:hypothetical protein
MAQVPTQNDPNMISWPQYLQDDSDNENSSGSEDDFRVTRSTMPTGMARAETSQNNTIAKKL